jgi:hypothetical protein
MSSHTDSFVASGSSPSKVDSPTPPDFLLENHFSIFLLSPISPAGFAWIQEHLPADRITFGKRRRDRAEVFVGNPRRIAGRRVEHGVAMMDKRAVAGRIRKRLEQRLSNFLKCEPQDLARLKLGTLIHTLFLFEGDTEVLPGFNTAMGAVLSLVGNELVWEEPRAEEQPEAGGIEGGQLMEMTLDQMRDEILNAIRTLSWRQRMDVAAALLEDLKKPVGELERHT